MADDGTLWLRCVFDDGHASVVPHDPITCREYWRQLGIVEATAHGGLS